MSITYTQEQIDRLNIYFNSYLHNDMMEHILSKNQLISLIKETIHHEYEINNIIKTINDFDDIILKMYIPIDLVFCDLYKNLNLQNKIYSSYCNHCELYCGLLCIKLSLYSPIIDLYEKDIISLFNITVYEINKYIIMSNSFDDDIKLSMMENIKNFKEKINSIAIEFNIKLPEDLATHLSRSERIYRILIFENQIEEYVGNNVKQIIQNSDLNRYILEFID